MSDVDIKGLNNCRIQTVNDILDLSKMSSIQEELMIDDSNCRFDGNAIRPVCK